MVKKNERNIKVKALVNLKYDKDVVKIGGEFLVRETDLKSMEGLVDIIGNVEAKGDNNLDNNGEAGTGTEKDNE